MICELCGIDVSYYDDVLRPFEGLAICFGCYAIDMRGFTWELIERYSLIRESIRAEFAGLTGEDYSAQTAA